MRAPVALVNHGGCPGRGEGCRLDDRWVNPHFTDENATAMIMGDDALMLLIERFSETLTGKQACHAAKATEAIIGQSGAVRWSRSSVSIRAGMFAGSRCIPDGASRVWSDRDGRPRGAGTPTSCSAAR